MNLRSPLSWVGRHNAICGPPWENCKSRLIFRLPEFWQAGDHWECKPFADSYPSPDKKLQGSESGHTVFSEFFNLFQSSSPHESGRTPGVVTLPTNSRRRGWPRT